jgi:hypothetical protein
MFRDLIPVPIWLARIFYKHPGLVSTGFLVALIACLLITYKVQQANGGRFRRLVLAYLYSLAFFLAFNFLFYNPFWNSIYNMAAGLPGLVSLILLARYMVKEFGIGGQNAAQTPQDSCVKRCQNFKP